MVHIGQQCAEKIFFYSELPSAVMISMVMVVMMTMMMVIMMMINRKNI